MVKAETVMSVKSLVITVTIHCFLCIFLTFLLESVSLLIQLLMFSHALLDIFINSDNDIHFQKQ